MYLTSSEGIDESTCAAPGDFLFEFDSVLCFDEQGKAYGDGLESIDLRYAIG